MRIQPQSTVTLYSGVDIDFTSGVEIAFSSLANQNSYFASKLAFQEINCTVVKKTGRLRLEAPGSTVKNCNYLSFINPSFENKRIYAMILDYNYINNECTEISYQIDFWQTWMFDVNFEESGIVRQYLNETDYTRAAANPYDKRIYAFQTPENLPYNKALEKYNYEFRLSNGGNGKRAMVAGDADVDGCYPMVMTKYETQSSAFDTLLGEDMCYLIMLAPIDFSALGEDARTTYQGWINSIGQVNGFCIQSNKEFYSIGDPYSGTGYNHNLWSSFPHPYDVWLIPKHAQINTNVDFINTFIEQLTTWHATGQIIAMYAVPKYVAPFFGVTSVGDVDSANNKRYNFDNDDTFVMNTAFARMNKVNYSGYKPHCQKLYLNPYSYVRVETPDGDIGEYRYEDFANINGPSVQVQEITFRVIATANGKPKVVLMPLKYRDIKLLSDQQTTITDEDGHTYVYTPDTAGNYNVDARIELNSFPQVPFVLDAFLAHLSASYMNEVAQNTSQAQIEREHNLAIADANVAYAGLESTAELGKDAVSSVGLAAGGALAGFAVGGPVGAVIGGLIGGSMGGMGTVSDMAKNTAVMEQAHAMRDATQAKIDMLSEASSFLSDPSKDNPRFNDTKPAFANNIYVPGSMGDTSYLKLSSLTDFKVTQVTLRDEILEKYDKYFKTYGYNFGATVGIPYVVKYTQGSNSNDELPHWEQVNGKDSTYVKTHDCHITHSMLPVSVAIEGMFNCGVRMLKGETL